jgi:hypothetical protein
VLVGKYPSLKNGNSSFDYTKVKVNDLVTATGLSSAGASANEKVVAVLTGGTDFQKSLIVAQLNYILLSGLPGSEMGKCIKPGELQAMASGSFKPSGLGVTWDSAQIVEFLKKNWFAS